MSKNTYLIKQILKFLENSIGGEIDLEVKNEAKERQYRRLRRFAKHEADEYDEVKDRMNYIQHERVRQNVQAGNKVKCKNCNKKYLKTRMAKHKKECY